MKGSLAAMLAAVKALNQASVELDGDLLLTAWLTRICQPWQRPSGAALPRRCSHRHRADRPGAGLAHRGFASFEVETIGRAAHGSRYQDGIDAILLMGRFLSGLDALSRNCYSASRIHWLARLQYTHH